MGTSSERDRGGRPCFRTEVAQLDDELDVAGERSNITQRFYTEYLVV